MLVSNSYRKAIEVLMFDVLVIGRRRRSSTTGTEPIEAMVKESGGCESQEQEVRSSGPCKKEPDACDEVTGVDVPEKSPVLEAEGQPLVSPMSLGNSLIDVDVEKKTKANGGSTGLNRGKKQQLKANIGVAWGKLSVPSESSYCYGT